MNYFELTRNSIVLIFACDDKGTNAKVEAELKKLDPESYEVRRCLAVEGEAREITIMADKSDIVKLHDSFKSCLPMFF